uniref:Secreted protein n=1 Tax=Triticum urartu TaxID=4572 RepID=A0A8R7UP54_TRIUA
MRRCSLASSSLLLRCLLPVGSLSGGVGHCLTCVPSLANPSPPPSTGDGANPDEEPIPPLLQELADSLVLPQAIWASILM